MPHFCGRAHSTRLRAEAYAPPLAPVVRWTGPAHEEIAELAYSYWEKRGRSEGSPWEDWFRAERELMERRRRLLR